MIFLEWAITCIAYDDERVSDNIFLPPARQLRAARVRESGNRRAPGVDVKKGYGTKARDKLTVHRPGAG
jgi:hypothetical protein